MPTVFYIARKQFGAPRARQCIEDCLNALEIVPIDRQTLVDAQAIAGSDFEDDIQIACAVAAKLDAIVIRDASGFVAAPIPVLTPSELAAQLATPTP